MSAHNRDGRIAPVLQGLVALAVMSTGCGAVAPGPSLPANTPTASLLSPAIPAPTTVPLSTTPPALTVSLSPTPAPETPTPTATPLPATSTPATAEATSTLPLTELLPLSAGHYASIAVRFGVGLTTLITVSVNGVERPASITDYDVASLGAGWYSDWKARLDPPHPAGMRYAQLIWVSEGTFRPSADELGPIVEANPGSLWIVGNEPECIWQGKNTPQQYAQVYREVYTLIKQLDPTAWVAIGGVVAPTPLRLQWLETVLAEYKSRYGQAMPVDVWNIHVQILQERAADWGAEIPAGIEATEGELYGFSAESGYYDNANPEIFRQLVLGFRQWMKEKGFGNKPLIVSEYGVLLPSNYIGRGDGYGDPEAGDEVLKTFMRETFDFLVNTQDPELGYPADGNRLVQQWLWYSVNEQPFDETTGVGFNGALFNYLHPEEITPFGVLFRDYVQLLRGQ